MAFKRPGSTVYQIRRRSLPGYGDTGQLSSGVRDKRLAERMEKALEELAERALVEPRYRALLDAICRPPHPVSLAQLMQARAARRVELLLATLSDPPLAEVCAALASAGRDRVTTYGLEKLPELMGPGARLSSLFDPVAIVDALRRAEEAGRHRNTVRRQFYRAISLVLRERVGEAERTRIMSAVDYEGVDDTREVIVSPAEISRLLDAADRVHDQMRTLCLCALLASADRGVLLRGDERSGRGLLVRDVAIYQEDAVGGETFTAELSLLHDAKTAGRARIVVVGDELARALLLLCRGRDPEDSVFSITYSQLDHLWHRTRDAARLPGLRFKDLRAQFAIYADRAGIPTVVASRAMGHAHERMTARYQRHQAAMTSEYAAALAGAMLVGAAA